MPVPRGRRQNRCLLPFMPRERVEERKDALEAIYAGAVQAGKQASNVTLGCLAWWWLSSKALEALFTSLLQIWHWNLAPPPRRAALPAAPPPPLFFSSPPFFCVFALMPGIPWGRRRTPRALRGARGQGR